MKTCGVEIKGSDAIFALAELVDGKYSHIPLETKKLSLADDEDPVSVQSFYELLEGFVRDNGVGRIAVKKRSKKGNYAGGAITFKIEGLLQLLRDCEVTLVPAPTIAAADRKCKFHLPGSLSKYQHDAYKVACATLFGLGS